MAHATTETLKKASKKAKANIFSSTERTIKERGLTTRCMGGECTFGQTEEPTKVSGLTTSFMVVVYILGQKEEATKVGILEVIRDCENLKEIVSFTSKLAKENNLINVEDV